MKCSGLEYDVAECETENVGINFNHSLDVGVMCQPGMLKNLYAQYINTFIPLQLMKLIGREMFI